MAFDPIAELAPAKINLALHVTGRRADGYHLIETLVTFARQGDRLEFSGAPQDRFTLSGRFGSLLPADADAASGNLVLKARDRIRDALMRRGAAAPPVHIHLEKNLPVASGIGGGSADAAAALRGLMRLWDAELPADELRAIGLGLGADVPMCLASTPLIARGIGEAIEPLPRMPSFALVLANPLVAVSTPQVFQLLTEKNNPPLTIDGNPGTVEAWLAAIRPMRNDLERPARQLTGAIAEISALMAAEGAALTRMSGSGATCFSVFSTMAEAEAAMKALHSLRPGWYFQATETIPGDGSWHI